MVSTPVIIDQYALLYRSDYDLLLIRFNMTSDYLYLRYTTHCFILTLTSSLYLLYNTKDTTYTPIKLPITGRNSKLKVLIIA